MEHAELAAWLRLTLTPGIGNAIARKLLATFGLPDAIFRQSAAALAQVLDPAQVNALLREPDELGTQLETTWNWLQAGDASSAQRQVVALGDASYPAPLLDIDAPPLLLYLLGQTAASSRPTRSPAPAVPDASDLISNSLARSIAIVGSRNPTPQGAANARQFARALSEAGLTVVSGLALGVDGAAHEGALEGAGHDPQRLATIAVVGTGLDRVYPKNHLELAHRIAQHGLLISEYPLGTPPLPANFPRRNRIIAGLSRGALVIEAALKSGSLITARLAAEQGKEVFAIPGSIHSTQSHGCHALIRQGAKLVESAQDVLEEIGFETTANPVAQPAHSPLSDDPSGSESDLLRALGFDPVGLDALQARTGIDTATLQARLMALELDGQVVRLPGGLFQRMAIT